MPLLLRPSPTIALTCPPSRRAGSERSIGSDMRRKNNENAIRIGNLSEDAQDTDLVELCRPFGQVVRAHIPKDYKTGSSRGYGFVNFICKEDVERAIEKLNGYGYDNLILSVEWSVRTKQGMLKHLLRIH